MQVPLARGLGDPNVSKFTYVNKTIRKETLTDNGTYVMEIPFIKKSWLHYDII